MIRTLIPLLLLAACTTDSEQDLDLRDPPEELEIPDLSDVDLDALYADALRLALAADTRVAWDAHEASLGYGQTGCPDFFAGTPDLENMDIPEDAPGWSWADHCTTAGGEVWGGFAYWENRLDVDLGDEVEGDTTNASRMLIADGIVADDTDAVLNEFDGEASDSLLLVDGEGYSHWVYSSLMQGTATGTLPFDDNAALGVSGGWRVDMFKRATGGDADTLELRGNMYLFEHRMDGRFDSVTANLVWAAPDSLGPDGCDLEPAGWIGVRDENAFWFDVVFQPRYDDDATDDPYENFSYGPCDGCGTLYVRGLEQTEIEVCPDLTFLWSGELTHPTADDYALSMREILGGIP